MKITLSDRAKGIFNSISRFNRVKLYRVLFVLFAVAASLLIIPMLLKSSATVGNSSHTNVSETQNFLADQVVTTNADSGAGSLRQAVIDANAGDTITFDSSVTGIITLTSGEILIDKNLTITGPGARVLTVRRDSGVTRFRIFTVTSGVTVNISGLTISGGHTADNGSSGSGVEGGGIRNAGTLTLTGVAVSGNRTGNGGPGTAGSGGIGGGIRNLGTLTITNSTISGNLTGDGGSDFTAAGGPSGTGGGISNGLGTLTITNSTISGNQTGNGGSGAINGSRGEGGGIHSGNATLTITGSTITANGASGGGGIRRNGSGTVTLRSTIVAGNSATAGADIRGDVQSDGYNLVQSIANGNINQNPGAGPNITGVDPQLGALANNGGPTQTHRLLDTSPAIDKGDDFSATNTTDQRGFLRPFDDPSITNAGDGSDIGAFETQKPPIKVPLDFDGDGKSDYAVIQGTFSRPSGERSETEKGIEISGDLLADNNQRFWEHDYDKLLHLRAGRGFLELPKDVQAAQAAWKERGREKVDNPSIEAAVGLNWMIRRSSDGTTLNYTLGTNTDIFVPADYDGDGKTDAAIWNSTSGFTVIQSSTLSPITYPLGLGNTNADPTVVGDYDGDGIDDPAIYDSATGMWHWSGSAAHTTAGSATWIANAIPAPGDYNGDGKMDFAVQLPPVSTPEVAKFRIAFNDGSVGPGADITLSYGLAVYAIVPGDYDGDGKCDIAQVNMTESSMVWKYLTSSSNYSVQVKKTFGVTATDRTVQGDYDGDGKIDLAIYRRSLSPEDGVFIVFQSSTSTQSASFDWGDIDDYPIGFFNTH